MRKLSLLAALAMLAMLALAPAAFAQADRDCKDFPSQMAAQNYFDANGGSSTNNFDDLDADQNGKACDNYSYGGSAGAGGAKSTATTIPNANTTPAVATSATNGLPKSGGPTLLLPAIALLLGASLVVLGLSRRDS